jgi:hypothetical protein
LPYRKCYTQEQLEQAYPQIQKFTELKEQYDPSGLFSNLWFEKYLLPRMSREFQKRWKGNGAQRKGKGAQRQGKGAQRNVGLKSLKPLKRKGEENGGLKGDDDKLGNEGVNAPLKKLLPAGSKYSFLNNRNLQLQQKPSQEDLDRLLYRKTNGLTDPQLTRREGSYSNI